MIFNLLIVTIKFILIESTLLGCDPEIEVYWDKFCYKLIHTHFYSDLLNCSDSFKLHQNTSIYAICLKEMITKLGQVYANNKMLESKHKFTYLNNQTILKKLVSIYSHKNQSVNNVLMSAYAFQGNIFVENVALGEENPNLMIHEDPSLEANEKCIYGHQVKSNNESFNFKYGSCDKKLPFMCMKSVWV
jgi:hypothetical protein